MTTAPLVPVHILTGFLGSGKTTLLNRAMQRDFGAGTGVLVNEFGDVGLDHLFVQGASEEVIVLKSGCVCCSIRSDLPSSLLRLLAFSTIPDSPLRRIVIETSGLSEPLPILQTLQSDARLRARCFAASVVCVVDATAGTAVGARREARAQVTAADVIVVTKTDMVSESQIQAVQRAVSVHNPLAQVLRSEQESLFSAMLDRESAPREIASPLLGVVQAERSAHTAEVRSLALAVRSPISWPRFAVWLTCLIHVHGERILRTKGVLFDAERDAWIGVHGVRRFLHPPVHLALAAPPADGGWLVFIAEKLDMALIEASFRRWHDSTALEQGIEQPAAVSRLDEVS